MKTQKLNKKDLENIVKGACFLASGGGGSYSAGMKLSRHFEKGYYKSDSFEMVSSKEIKPKMGGIVVAYIGAPENAKDFKVPDAAVSALETFKQQTNKDVHYIIPVEIGALSTTVACLVAAKMSVPVLDGDCAGRAVPTLNLISLSTCGISVNPTIIAGTPAGSQKPYVSIEISDSTKIGASDKIESMVRPIISQPEYNQIAGLAMWYVEDIRSIDGNIIENSVSRCKTLGELITSQQASSKPDVRTILNFFPKKGDYHATILYQGKLKTATTQTAGGFDNGIITIEVPVGKTKSVKEINLIFQNESMLLWDSELDTPRVMAPDLISYFILKEGENSPQLVYSNSDIMGNNQLFPGFENADILVVGLQAPELLRGTEQKLALYRQKSIKTLLKNYTSSEIIKNNHQLPKNYMSFLNTMGYYGKYIPIESINKGFDRKSSDK